MLSRIIRSSLIIPRVVNTNLEICSTQKRYSSFGSSKLQGDPEEYTKYEIFKEPPEWRFVERLIPPPTVPVPRIRDVYHSDWVPQTAKPGQLPYFLERTKNHQLPVFLIISHRGTRRLTHVKNISGDVWALADQLSAHLNKLHKRNVGIRVDEVSGKIIFRTDVYSDVVVWLLEKGF
ncbi:probable 39S ribosomal protein L49, mitochondrial [Nilaparvata lugens]|uniref:probable 39S ribosomal protein L49, mitochondrial n=1 Tax=Nilaparvata lugens TaxID=108931 RepID=UPI000B991E5F|nr:probable 39S ribosomal protein L49, mitochondrial [Nilaparvata lugens]